MDDRQLGDNPARLIERVGDTVHRPMHHWSPAVHDLLRYLEQIDFKYAPKVLGIDDEGREVLSYIEGQSGGDSWTKIISDEGLRKYAKLLRTYHDSVKDYKPSHDAEWAYVNGSTAIGELVCHGDFGPWNIVWDGDEPVGIIDWDMARPGKTEFDVLYALEYAAPFRSDEETLAWHHFPIVPDRKHRIVVFLEAYSAESIPNITSRVAAMEREVNTGARAIAARGIAPQAGWLADGTIDTFDAQVSWMEANHHLFE